MGANETQLGFQPSGDSSRRCDSQRVLNSELLQLFSPALQATVLEDSNPGRGRGRGAGFRRLAEYSDGFWPGRGGDEEDSRLQVQERRRFYRRNRMRGLSRGVSRKRESEISSQMQPCFSYRLY